LEKILRTPFILCSKPPEPGFQQHVKPRAWRPRPLSGWEDRKAAREQAGFLQRKLSSQSQLPSPSTDSLWPFKFYLSSERSFFKPTGANQTAHLLEESKGK